MLVHVVLEQEDLAGGGHTVLADTNAILKENSLIYTEGNTNFKHTVTFTEEIVTIKRKSEIQTTTILRNDGTGKSVIDSEYGSMEVGLKVHTLEKSESEWKVEYEILDGEGSVGHLRFTWHIMHMA